MIHTPSVRNPSNTQSSSSSKPLLLCFSRNSPLGSHHHRVAGGNRGALWECLLGVTINFISPRWLLLSVSAPIVVAPDCTRRTAFPRCTGCPWDSLASGREPVFKPDGLTVKLCTTSLASRFADGVEPVRTVRDGRSCGIRALRLTFCNEADVDDVRGSMKRSFRDSKCRVKCLFCDWVAP